MFTGCAVARRIRHNFRRQSRLSPKVVCGALALLLVVTVLAPSAGQARIYHPRSTIDRPFGPGPAFLLGTMGLGASWKYDGPGAVYGGAILLRPNRAADLVGPFYDWNTGAMLQCTWHYAGEDRSLIAVDGIARRYLSDMRGDAEGQSFFVGGGIGIARCDFGSLRRKSFTYPLEAGWEYGHHSGAVLMLVVEYRYTNGDLGNYTGWSARTAFGVPLPW